jgi:KDO2-lipid IV(A) lauroyltransferase
VTIPVERLQDQRLLDLMLDLRRSHGVQMLPLIGMAAMRAMIQALRGNKIVLIMADRATAGQVVEKLFFGRPAHLPLGPVMLAERTGAALVAAFCWRTSGSYIQTQILPLSLALPKEQWSDTDALMQGVIERMEEFISAHPEQWVMFAPLWEANKAPLMEKASMQHQVSDF